MKGIPISIILSWPLPNYIDPPTTGDYAVILNALFLGIALMFVALRVYGRATSSRWLGWDDVFIVIGAVLAIGLSASSMLANYRYKCNRHLWDIPSENWEYNLKLAIVAKVLFVSSGAFVRQSLLAFYLRLVGDADLRRAKVAVHCATVFNITSCIASNLVSIVNCVPVSAYWHYPSEQYGSCVNEGASVIALGAIVAGLDIIIVLLPLWIIIKLQMPLRRKIGVGILLNLGLVSSGAAGLRTYYSWKAFVETYDVTWWATPLWVCATVEVDLAIMCACAPALRALLTEKAPWAITPFRKIGNGITRCFTEYVSPKHSYADTSTAVSSEPLSDNSQRKADQRFSYLPKSAEKSGYSDDVLLTERPGSETDSSSQADNATMFNPIDQEAVIYAATQAIKGIEPLPTHLMSVHRQSTSYPDEVERENERIINTTKRLQYQSEKADQFIVEAPISRKSSARKAAQEMRSSDEMDLPVKLMHSVDHGYGRDGPLSRTTSQISKKSASHINPMRMPEETLQRGTSQASRRDRSRSRQRDEAPLRASDEDQRPTTSRNSTFRSEWAARQEAKMLAARQARPDTGDSIDTPAPAPPADAAAYRERPLPEEPVNFSRTSKRANKYETTNEMSTLSSNTSSKHGGRPTFLSMDSGSSDNNPDEEAELQAEMEERIRQRKASLTKQTRRGE